MKAKQLALSVAMALGFAGSAGANPILTDLTTADYITVGGLDWAWASPVSYQYWGNNVLYQANLHAGWREATDAEWASQPLGSDFGGKCASKYWNSYYTHCDFADYTFQHWNTTGGGFDLLYVRGASIDVPEPASVLLMTLGLLGLGALHRRS